MIFSCSATMVTDSGESTMKQSSVLVSLLYLSASILVSFSTNSLSSLRLVLCAGDGYSGTTSRSLGGE